MSLGRTLVVVLLVVLLAADLAAANGAVAADRTVLDAGFVTHTLAKEGAYAQVEPLVVDSLPLDQLNGSQTAALPIDPQTVAASALDAAYVRSQVDPNVRRTFAYLHGRTDTLDLAVNLSPAKVAIGDAVAAQVANASVAELLGGFGANASDLTVSADGVSLDLRTVAAMANDKATFTSQRQAFRSRVRERVVTALVDQAFQQASDDQLLALVIDNYDPNNYTDAQKAQLVQDHRTDIRAALRNRIETQEGDQITSRVDSQLASMRTDIRANVSTALDQSLNGVDPAVADPAKRLALVGVDGYVADIGYDQYHAEFTAAKDALATGVGTVVQSRLDSQVPNRLDLTDQLGPSARDQLRTGRQVVGLVDLLSMVLPVVGLALVGLLYVVTRSIETTALGGGLGLVVGGLPGVVGATSLGGLLRSAMGGSVPAAVERLVTSLAGQVAHAVLVQSGLVVALGVVLVAAGLALRLELVELSGSAAE